MDQSTFVKRLYAIVAVGACALMVPVVALMKNGLSPRGFAVAGLIWSTALFAAFFRLIRSRQRFVASGVPAEVTDREQCVRTIRSLKKLIAVFAVFLGYGLLATRGGPLLARAAGAAVDVFFLAAFVHSLIRAQERLKELPPDRATEA